MTNFEGKVRNVNTKKPWSGLGLDATGAKSLAELLQTTQLNFNVQKNPLYTTHNGITIPVQGQFATVREDDGTVLGTVGSRYEIIQNTEAFSFLDSMVDEGMSFEMGGTTFSGAKSWVMGKLNPMKILGDEYTPYIYFENSYDGSGTVKLCVVMLRQWCLNGCSYLIKNNAFSWGIRHSKTAMDKLELAHKNMLKAESYATQFDKEMDLLQQTKLSSIEEFAEFIFPLEGEDISARKQTNIEGLRENIIDIYNSRDDIRPFIGSQYAGYMAITDWASHAEPQRQTKTWEESRFLNLVNGNEQVRRAQEFFQIAG